MFGGMLPGMFGLEKKGGGGGCVPCGNGGC